MSKLALLLMLPLVLLVSQDVDFNNRDRTQIIINTQRLADLERRLRQLEEGGSAVAMSTAGKATVNEFHIKTIEDEIHDIKSVIVGVTVFTLTHLLGFVVYLLKNRIIPEPKDHTRRS